MLPPSAWQRSMKSVLVSSCVGGEIWRRRIAGLQAEAMMTRVSAYPDVVGLRILRRVEERQPDSVCDRLIVAGFAVIEPAQANQHADDLAIQLDLIGPPALPLALPVAALLLAATTGGAVIRGWRAVRYSFSAVHGRLARVCSLGSRLVGQSFQCVCLKKTGDEHRSSIRAVIAGVVTGFDHAPPRSKEGRPSPEGDAGLPAIGIGANSA